MAKLLTIEVRDRRFFADGREIWPSGRISLAGGMGHYRLLPDRVQRVSAAGVWVYTYLFPGDGIYRFGPVFAQKLNRLPDETDDPGTFYHASEEERREGCTHWSHWYTMTKAAKDCFLEANPGRDHFLDDWGRRVNHPDVINGTSGYWEWAAKNLEEFRAYLEREKLLFQEAEQRTVEQPGRNSR